MTIQIEHEISEFLFEQLAIENLDKYIENVIINTLDYMKCPYEAECNVLLTTNEEIHKMNQEFQIGRAHV